MEHFFFKVIDTHESEFLTCILEDKLSTDRCFIFTRTYGYGFYLLISCEKRGNISYHLSHLFCSDTRSSLDRKIHDIVVIRRKKFKTNTWCE